MTSILAEFRRWFSSQDRGGEEGGDAMVPRRSSESRSSVGDNEGRVKDAIRRFDNMMMRPKEMRPVSGGSSGEIGKNAITAAASDTPDGKDESDDSEVQHLGVNDTSFRKRFGVYEQIDGEIIEVFQHPDDSTSEGNSTYPATDDSDSGTRQQNLGGEGKMDISDLTPSKLWSSNKFEVKKGIQESSVTKSSVLSQPQSVNNSTSGSCCRGGLLFPAGTMSQLYGGPLIDTQAPGSVAAGNKLREQVTDSGRLQHRCKENRRYRSYSCSQCPTDASAAPARTIRADRGKTLPSKLNHEEYSERIVLGWKRKRLSSLFSRGVVKPPKDVTASPNSADAPDTSRWKGILSGFSVRKVGNVILATVTELFSHILSKPSSSTVAPGRRLSNSKRGQKDPQESAWDTVKRRKKGSMQIKDEVDESKSLQSGTGEHATRGAGETHDAEEKVLASREDTGRIPWNEGRAAHDSDDDNVARNEFPQGTNRVRELVRIIEGNKGGNTTSEKQKDATTARLIDAAIEDMILPLASRWDDEKQRPQNEPIKVEEISKEVSRQDANTLIPQSEMCNMKENEDQTCIAEPNEAETGRGSEEEENKENEEGKDTEIKITVEEVDGSESDTDKESEDENSEIIMRSKPRYQTVSFYRYCTLGPHRQARQNPSAYRFSMVRPRTVIISSFGVCTETKFINDSFGDGVSETESEDEEDISPAPVPAPAPTPTRQRPTTPSRTSRPHSPLSDMDTESKRNSQAVSTEPSDLEDHSSVTTSDLDCHEPPVVDSRKDKAYRIALELLHTERTYVKVLHLIDQEFQFRVDNENRAHHMFPHDVILHMFSNIKSIYKLHHDFLLPQLEERMAQWEHNRRIGDIMKNFAPFLKMYTEYVRNFDNAMTLINQWQAKCPRFAAIMDDIHSMEVCGNLTLQHHMLSPVQRIPRYEMLLRDYLKKLPEDSPDCHDTEKALHLVSTAANHANDAMKKIDKFEKLLEIQESLGGAEDLVSPTRELIKEGKIIKISARSGDHQERYIFLLTDLLLLCSPRLMGGRVMSGPQYRLRAKYHVENLIIQEGDNLETANTFYIKDNNKSVELYTQTIEEKEQWLDAFICAIHETSQRKSSLKLHFNPNQRIMDVDLGQKQPMLIRSDSVTKCMECGSQFTMVRRKHHCRACGAVVCSKCSSFKASLAYECGKSVRVCRTCHATLQELSSSTATPSPEIDEGDECSVYSAKEHLDLPFRNRGVLEVSAKTSGAVMQGFLQLKTHRKTWVKRWFALHTDFVLYSFKCEADDQALTATPVPGFTVTHLQGTRNESGISDKEKERAFKLHHAKKQYIFQAASKDESQRWVAALKKASQAELPSPVQ